MKWVYIRPILENTYEVLDNCDIICYSNNWEKLLLDTAKIVTGYISRNTDFFLMCRKWLLILVALLTTTG